MKKILFLLVSAGLGLAVNAQNKNEKEPFTTKTFSESVRNVEVKTSGGSITVAGSDAGGARVDVFVQPSNNRDVLISKEEIQRRLSEDYELNISVSSNKLTAIAKPKERNMDWKKGLSISFKITVPKGVTTDLATSGGSISLRDLNGTNEFATSGGSLHVDNLSGKTKGRTSGGSIHVANSKDNIDLATSGGSIHADKCSGNLRLATSGGSLNLTALKGDIKANTSGGSIRGENIDGELSTHTSGGSINLRDLSCSVEASTSGGHVDVAIKTLGKYVRLSNSGGNIELKVPKGKGIDLKLRGDRVSSETLANFSGTMDKKEIEGKLNGGGIPVSANAGSGKVTLSVL
jgi:hypothetical protein